MTPWSSLLSVRWDAFKELLNKANMTLKTLTQLIFFLTMPVAVMGWI